MRSPRAASAWASGLASSTVTIRPPRRTRVAGSTGAPLHPPMGAASMTTPTNRRNIATALRSFPRERRQGIMWRLAGGLMRNGISRRAALRAAAGVMIGSGVPSTIWGATMQGQQSTASDLRQVKALVFDVFGTVVDWRTSVAREVEAVAKRHKVDGGRRGVRRRLARRLRAQHEPRAHRTAAVDAARRPAPHDAGRPARPVQPHRAVGAGGLGAEPRVASAAALAGHGARPDASEAGAHHRAALERQHRADDRHGAGTPACRGTASSAPSWCGTTSRTARSTSPPPIS